LAAKTSGEARGQAGRLRHAVRTAHRLPVAAGDNRLRTISNSRTMRGEILAKTLSAATETGRAR